MDVCFGGHHSAPFSLPSGPLKFMSVMCKIRSPHSNISQSRDPL